MRTLLTLLLVTALTAPLLALVELEIDPKTTPEVILSSHSPNRISLEEGEIVGMHFDSSRFQGVLSEKTGEAFLSPRGESNVSSAVTFRTSTGKSQTLNVFAKNIPGEVVYLQEKKGKKRTGNVSLPPLSTDYHSRTVELLNDILSYKEPKGYGPEEVEKAEAFPMSPPLEATPTYFFEGPFDTLLVLSIRNLSKKAVSVDPSSLKSANERWIFSSKRYLHPGEMATLVVCRKKKEGSYE